jgi:hypothetical protein
VAKPVVEQTKMTRNGASAITFGINKSQKKSNVPNYDVSPDTVKETLKDDKPIA